MKVLASWFNDYLSTKLDAPTLAQRLGQAGVEIEQIISSNKLDKNIVVAEVKKVAQHPNADRLKLVDVDMGTETARVVCGAPNVQAGQKVALAHVGTVLPDGTEIKAATIRGEESQGMLCSALELGISDDHTGILVLDPTYQIGTTLCDVWDFGEILDLTTAANRPDLLSVVGLAREIAAQGGEVAETLNVERLTLNVEKRLVGVVEKTLVREYKLAHVKLGKNGESPQWIKQRLVASGFRPVNCVVDITNYVMLELGQPLHAFDAANVVSPVDVRSPLAGETLTTLDGNEHKLVREDLIIADAKAPLALAGVMGGLTSQIITETNEILLEAANFDGATVRQMAVRHGLRTDASSRFERNLPLPLVDLGLNRALELLVELCDAEILAVSSQETPKTVQRQLSVSIKRVEGLLGIPVKRALAEKALRNLGFGVAGSGDTLELSLPWWRPDVAMEADIVEEIGRSIGYDTLPATLPAWVPRTVEFDQYWPRLWELKAILRGLGLDEVVTYSFVSRQQLDAFDHNHTTHLKLKNPLSVEQAYLRSTLAPSLIETVARNARPLPEFGIFEISKVFVAGANHSQQPDEPQRLGVAWRLNNGFTKAKNVIDTLGREFSPFQIMPQSDPMFKPGRSAQVLSAGQPIGWVGEIHPDILNRHKLTGTIGYLEIDLLPWLTAPTTKTYQATSRYPSINRDLAIVVKRDVLWADIEAEAKRAASSAEVSYLSEYYGPELAPDSKSVALRLTLSSLERTLTDAEADAGAQQVLQALEKTFKAKQRV